MIDIEVTKEEDLAIKRLQRLAKVWPDSLWLFSASGSLCVMRNKENGERAITDNGGVDPDYIVDSIAGIENDGGDW